MSDLQTSEGICENRSHFWAEDPSILESSASIGEFTVGSGQDIYDATILPAIESARFEVILVTCFWARSPSLNNLSSTLRTLSKGHYSRPAGTPKIRVRLCFSSRSLFQKLCHTSSPEGHIYPPSQWVSKLGLPAVEDLQGLDLRIKSIFFRPFSVMHPKFIIVDRRLAFIPSCNVSWETWLECCLPLTGPIVSSLLQVWRYTWGRDDLPAISMAHDYNSSASFTCPSTLLPSPNHQWPLFRPFLPAPSAPPTPLNTYILHAILTATKSVTFLTPNLTSPPVIAAILAALDRGIDVSIITNRRMMILEQLLTAGTITEICIWNLVREYRKLEATTISQSASRVEVGSGPIGRLRTGYFTSGREAKCHIKCTVVDGEIVVLGSGNMDRASWYTSQELGVVLQDREIVKNVWETLERNLNAKVEPCFGW